jgi:hypothetical protein
MGIRLESKTSVVGERLRGRRLFSIAYGICLLLPLGGCLLTDKPEPGLDIP